MCLCVCVSVFTVLVSKFLTIIFHFPVAYLIFQFFSPTATHSAVFGCYYFTVRRLIHGNFSIFTSYAAIPFTFCCLISSFIFTHIFNTYFIHSFTSSFSHLFLFTCAQRSRTKFCWLLRYRRICVLLFPRNGCGIYKLW